MSDEDFRYKMHHEGPAGFHPCTRPWPHDGPCAHRVDFRSPIVVKNNQPTGVSAVHDMVREGRITPAEGATLLQLREELRLARRPWWQKFLSFLYRAFLG